MHPRSEGAPRVTDEEVTCGVGRVRGASRGCNSEPEPYPTEAWQNYWSACFQQGAPRWYCSCTFDWFQENIPYDEFRTEEVKLVVNQQISDRLAGWVVRANTECQ